MPGGMRELGDPEWRARLAAAFHRMLGRLLTPYGGDVQTAVRAVKAGAVDVVQKPDGDRKLLDGINKGLQAEATD